MRVFVANLLLFLRSLVIPFVVLAAFALICYGVSMLCYPAAFITGGILILIAVIDASVDTRPSFLRRP